MNVDRRSSDRAGIARDRRGDALALVDAQRGAEQVLCRGKVQLADERLHL
jgi:hypothetical protein